MNEYKKTVSENVFRRDGVHGQASDRSDGAQYENNEYKNEEYNVNKLKFTKERD